MVGGCGGWRLVIGGWWRVAGGGWRVAGGGWWSLRAVLNKNKIGVLKDSPGPASNAMTTEPREHSYPALHRWRLRLPHAGHETRDCASRYTPPSASDPATPFPPPIPLGPPMPMRPATHSNPFFWGGGMWPHPLPGPNHPFTQNQKKLRKTEMLNREPTREAQFRYTHTFCGPHTLSPPPSRGPPRSTTRGCHNIKKNSECPIRPMMAAGG